MSYDGRIPPGGGVRPNTGEKLQNQPNERKVKGRFKAASGGNRDVSVSEGKTHIPAATGSAPKERALDEWEVSIRENEQLFFNNVADILTTEESFVKQDKLREELRILHTCMADLLNKYNRRISDLAANDRIMEKDLQQIKGPMIRVFQTVKDELVLLEKALAPNASRAAKKDAKDVLPIAKSQIQQANNTLAEAKALLVQSTLPELADLPELPAVKVHPIPKSVSSKQDVQDKPVQKKRTRLHKNAEPETKSSVENISPEQRLQNLKLILKDNRVEEVQGTLQHMVSVLEKLGRQLEEHIQEPLGNPKKNQKKAQFDHHLNLIRQASQEKVTPDKVSATRRDIRDYVFVCETCIKDITGWQGKVPAESPKTVAASEIQLAPLRKQVAALNVATSTAGKQEASKEIGRYIYAQHKRLKRLLPLLQAVVTKCDLEKRQPPAECAHFYEVMGRLDKAVEPINKRVLNEDYFSAVKEADAALTALDKFDQKLPASLWHDLTETVAQPGEATPHFLNLMCRRILNEETGPLSKRASLKKFTNICTYLDKVQGGKLGENTDADTIQALQKVVGDGFSSLEKVGALMAQARTLEEVRAVGFQLVNWIGMKSEYLDQICASFDQVADELKLELDPELSPGLDPKPRQEMARELKEIREGRDKLNELSEKFTSGTQAVAAQESANRLSRLEVEVKRALEQMVEERLSSSGFFNQFRSNKEVCETLQKELSEELGDIATIDLKPGKGQKEVLRQVEVKLSDAQEGIRKVNAVLNSRGKNATKLRRLLLGSDAKDVLVVEADKQTCRWEPHPQEMIQQFANDFVRNFEKYERGVSLAQKHERHINRLVVARGKVDDGIKHLEAAIPTVAQLKRKIRRGTKRRRLIRNLRQLKTQVNRLKGRPLKRLAEEAKPVRNLVVDMLKHRQLATHEAIKLLEPLSTVQQAAMGTAPALQIRTQPLPPEKARRTEALEKTLNDLQKKYSWNNLWHRLTGKKRLEAVETARSLVAICEACAHAPIANVQMLDNFIDELKKVKNPHPDYKLLEEGLSEYAQHLQKSSITMTYEQAKG